MSLTPDFHWDYEGCVEPSGCSTYGAQVYLAEGNYSSGSIIGTCNLGGASSTTPIKDAPFSCFHIGPLKPNTLYSWVVTPYFDGTVHAEQTWTYNFTTGSGASASCQMVSADKDLASIKLNDTVTFTGFGVTSDQTQTIDQIEFIISNNSSVASDSAVPAVRDAADDSKFGGTAWKATKAYQVTQTGSYSVQIKVHWQNQNVWKE